MALLQKIKGYLPNLKRDEPGHWKKFQKTCYDSETTPNEFFRGIVRAVSRYGLFDVDEIASGQASKKKQVKEINEKVDLAGALNKLADSFLVQKVQDTETQINQLNTLAVQPLQQDIQAMQQRKDTMLLEAEAGQKIIDEMKTEHKRGTKMLQDQRIKIQEAQDEFASLKSQSEKQRQDNAVSAANIPKNVPKGKGADKPIR